MAWYHWIGTYTIILSSLALFTIPYKPLWVILLFLALMALGVLSIMFLPEKEDEYFSQRDKS